jgi:hypothetical protein
MRQIFTSQRLETVEGVAQLLQQHGVETYISHSRSYKGRRRSSFSYRTADRDGQPGVWVVRADQLVQARDLLRTAGLLESTRSSYLPSNDGNAAPSPTARVAAAPRLASRVRLALLATVSVMAVITVMRMLGGA